MSITFYKIIGFLSFLVGAGSMALLSETTQSYQETMPKEMDQSVGRTHKLNNHGDIVYLTDSEQRLLDNYKESSLVFGCITAVCFFRAYGWKKPRY